MPDKPTQSADPRDPADAPTQPDLGLSRDELTDVIRAAAGTDFSRHPSGESRESDATADEPPARQVRHKYAFVPPFLPDPFMDHCAPNDPRSNSVNESWAVPWSDLMMVMFVLFAALLTALLMREQQERMAEALVEQEVEKQVVVEEPVPAPQADFAPLMRINVFESSKQALRRANINNVELALMDDQSVKVSVQGPMLFALGRAELREEVREFLASLAGVIRQTPFKVNVIGHTDDNPINSDIYPTNWELSVARASQVARFIIDQGDIDPARFTVMGRSEYEPVVPNDTDQSKALNRRVEIIITREALSADEGDLR